MVEMFIAASANPIKSMLLSCFFLNILQQLFAIAQMQRLVGVCCHWLNTDWLAERHFINGSSTFYLPGCRAKKTAYMFSSVTYLMQMNCLARVSVVSDGCGFVSQLIE